jgi:hypothetical protein
MDAGARLVRVVPATEAGWRTRFHSVLGNNEDGANSNNRYTVAAEHRGAILGPKLLLDVSGWSLTYEKRQRSTEK